MFVVIRTYAAGARADDVARRVGEGLVPILKQQPGFRAYYAFVGDDGRPVSVSVVDSRAAAMAANERTREIVMGDMLVDAATFDEEEERGRASGTAPWVDGGV